ncbi:MAG: hypothetical protein Q7K21_00240, partial [Elusimicrobiota bacterium]|nr:hypothetical protein [Elusimicrobiota bacterium]
MANPLTDKGFVRLLDDRLTKVYKDRYKAMPLIIDKFFDRKKSKKAWEEYFSVGSVPDPELFQGTIQYQGVSPGYHTKITPLEYAGGIT